VTVYAYDALNRMTGTSIQRPGIDASPISAATIAYDSLGRRQQITFADASTQAYTYDNADRPLTITHVYPSWTADNVVYSYTYDPAGRDYSKTISNALYRYATPSSGAGTTYATADSLIRYSTVGASSVSYWSEGHIYSDGPSGTIQNYYDETGHAFYASPSTSSDFAYGQPDAFGQSFFRIKSNPVGSPTAPTPGTDTLTYYTNDGIRPETVAEPIYTFPNPATNWNWLGWRFYVNGPNPDERLAFIDLNGSIYYPHTDRQGSAIALSTTGYAVATHAFGPYGETPDQVTVVATGADSYPFRYTGQRYDSDYGYYNYKARIYAPKLGRFMQTDPVGYDGGDLNLYAYVGDDPIDRSDPTGNSWEDWAHGALTAASFCPSVCGSAFSAADAGVYGLQGDKAGVAISLGAAALGVVSDAGAAKLGATAIKEGAALVRAERAAAVVEKTASGARVGDFTRAERAAAKAENAAQNGGKMACADCGREVQSVKSEKGVPTPNNQAQVHHDPPISEGGGRHSEPVVLCPPCHIARHTPEG
jgi:RHS repeat-associated protein